MTMVSGLSVSLPPPIERGGYVVRFAQDAADLIACQRLRHLCFVENAGRIPLPDGCEADSFDPLCDHVLIENADGALLCCFRLLPFSDGTRLSTSYSAQFYNVTRLAGFEAPMIELGRFCIHPNSNDPDVLRIAWGMLAAYVDAFGAGMLFGCSSFAGTDEGPYRGAFDLLATRFLVPDAWAIGEKASEILPFAKTAGAVQDHRAALGQVPALLRSYLTMGGWVSDHAVVDREMNTLHVFTGLEIAKVPAARAATLRAIVETDGLAKARGSS